jgi:hypothetical protein
MRDFALFSAQYCNAIELAAGQQFIALLATGFLLDGGQMLRVALFAAVAHWVVILTIILRRRLSPSRFDLGIIRFGFVPVGIAAGIIAGLMGRGA